jgi:ribulose-5-phosphate 4-epimerase/fuculose-1-phosphate aldolase
MPAVSDIAAIHRRFKTIGAALMRVNFNNTHSGNMSCRDPLDSGRFWITASGSQCGNLAPADLVALGFDNLHHEGTVRPSSEANTHRRVLELPGVKACVHCHSIASTLLGFETPRKPVFLKRADSDSPSEAERLFQPLDIWGAGLIGAVTVGVYRNTVGSSEMERRIPAYLKQTPVTIVQGHGPFACGESLDQCLQFLSVLENSAVVALVLGRRGLDTRPFQQAVRTQGFPEIFPWMPRRLGCSPYPAEAETDPAIRSEFAGWLSYNFEMGLSAFGTGSMSRKLSSDEMVFCPTSAAPEGLEAPLQRFPLQSEGPDAWDVHLHRRIYNRSPFRACMLTSSPLAIAEAMAALAAAKGKRALSDTSEASDRCAGGFAAVAPIDAEAVHYNVRLPVAELGALTSVAGEDVLSGLLQNGKGCGLISGVGVIAAAEDTLAQAAYRVSLAERIARFRQEVDLNHRLLGGPTVSELE